MTEVSLCIILQLQYVAGKVAFQETRESLWGTAEPALDTVLRVTSVHSIPTLPHGGYDRLAPLVHDADV